MGTRRIRHLHQLKAGEVLGFSRGSKRRLAAERKFEIPTTDSIEDLVREDLDAVFICVPPAAHLQYMEMAVDHGWHFMVEQPISHQMEGLEALVQAVRENRLVAHVSQNMRFHQAVRRIRELIAANAIGPVLTGIIERGEWLPDWHPDERYTDYYPSRRSEGGGLDVIIDLEWLVSLFGRISRMACFAAKKSSLDIDTDDVIQVMVEFENGPQILLHADMIQRAYSRRAKFVGENGTVEWDWERREIRLYTPEKKRWETFEEQVDENEWESVSMKPGWEWVEPMYLEDTRAFIDRLQRGDTETGHLRSGIENLRLLLSAMECSSSNQVWENPEL